MNVCCQEMKEQTKNVLEFQSSNACSLGWNIYTCTSKVYTGTLINKKLMYK